MADLSTSKDRNPGMCHNHCRSCEECKGRKEVLVMINRKGDADMKTRKRFLRGDAGSFLDRIDKINRIMGIGWNLNPVNPVNPV